MGARPLKATRCMKIHKLMWILFSIVCTKPPQLSPGLNLIQLRLSTPPSPTYTESVSSNTGGSPGAASHCQGGGGTAEPHGHVLPTHAEAASASTARAPQELPLPGRGRDTTTRQHQWNGHLIVSRMLLGWGCGAFGRALADGSNRDAHQAVPGREVAPRAG